ncbi:MAG: Stp1/IreP family PP2C-type Ser/Thr phosphatase, partial [Thermoleophilia bacterium]|nr:Stp1/IreP family PP2C-type Ser/Thr phosphatase [Thermoleophilia bacterium]
MLRIAEAAQLTDTGRQREANEDSYLARGPLFAVADGMGGAQAGEVASRMAVAAFERVDDPVAAPEELLRRTAEDANHEIFELAQGDSSRSGMGTTLTAALVHGDEISFGHVGDSRAYVFRDGRLRQITSDHSLVEELRRQGKLTRDQAADHPQRSVITRALGPEPTVDVDTLTFSARPGDVFLLCSDGLTTMLDDEDVAAVLDREEGLERVARRLVREANERGGRDNITVVLFRLETADEGAAGEGETLIGPAAAAAGLSAESMRSAPGSSGGAAAEAPRAPRRRPRRPAPAAPPPERRWPRRLLKGTVALLLAAVVAFAAVSGARLAWFIGTDPSPRGEDRLALFRGLPYELPFGIELYSAEEISTVPLEALPPDRREVAVNHELRSEDDARSLLEDLERATVT